MKSAMLIGASDAAARNFLAPRRSAVQIIQGAAFNLSHYFDQTSTPNQQTPETALPQRGDGAAKAQIALTQQYVASGAVAWVFVVYGFWNLAHFGYWQVKLKKDECVDSTNQNNKGECKSNVLKNGLTAEDSTCEWTTEGYCRILVLDKNSVQLSDKAKINENSTLTWVDQVPNGRAVLAVGLAICTAGFAYWAYETLEKAKALPYATLEKAKALPYETLEYAKALPKLFAKLFAKLLAKK